VSSEHTVACLLAAAERLDNGYAQAAADALRDTLPLLADSGQAATDHFGSHAIRLAAQFDELMREVRELHDRLRTSAENISRGGGIK
jgi:thiamine pyrophosphate-dependent acetolactate synthase large subunit-like protein